MGITFPENTQNQQIELDASRLQPCRYKERGSSPSEKRGGSRRPRPRWWRRCRAVDSDTVAINSSQVIFLWTGQPLPGADTGALCSGWRSLSPALKKACVLSLRRTRGQKSTMHTLRDKPSGWRRKESKREARKGAGVVDRDESWPSVTFVAPPDAPNAHLLR